MSDVEKYGKYSIADRKSILQKQWLRIISDHCVVTREANFFNILQSNRVSIGLSDSWDTIFF